MKAKIAANTTPTPKASNGLVFKRIIPITTPGTRNNQGEI